MRLHAQLTALLAATLFSVSASGPADAGCGRPFYRGRTLLVPRQTVLIESASEVLLTPPITAPVNRPANPVATQPAPIVEPTTTPAPAPVDAPASPVPVLDDTRPVAPSIQNLESSVQLPVSRPSTIAPPAAPASATPAVVIHSDERGRMFFLDDYGIRKIVRRDALGRYFFLLNHRRAFISEYELVKG